ncbi:MAG: hypothetical protein R3B70_01350 [Polyangiaceae bacterium]
MAKTLHLKGSGKLILRMTEQQLQDLQRTLQEESTTDRDYYIDETTLDHMEESGADMQLVKALRKALTDRRSAYRDPATPEPTVQEDDAQEGDGIDVEWRDSEEGS